MSDAKTTVLLIEGSPGDAQLVRELLTKASGNPFVVEHASRLSTGLARLAEGGIDVILCDLGVLLAENMSDTVWLMDMNLRTIIGIALLALVGWVSGVRLLA